MFHPLSDGERQAFLAQSRDSFIPGYTGHCPTLKFSYGRCYGTKTKEILRELREKRFEPDPQRPLYRSGDYKLPLLKPINKTKDITRDPGLEYRYRKSSPYISGYTGFIPTMNFRYGKSFGRTADDSICDLEERQRKVKENECRMERLPRAKSVPKLKPYRGEDELQKALVDYGENNRFVARKISPEDPPIAGYTGHIPRIKGNEESLSQRYNMVVKRGLKLLEEERERIDKIRNEYRQIPIDYDRYR